MYKLLTYIYPYSIGTIFTFEEKHKLMSELPWDLQREIKWEIIKKSNLN